MLFCHVRELTGLARSMYCHPSFGGNFSDGTSVNILGKKGGGKRNGGQKLGKCMRSSQKFAICMLKMPI